MGTWATDRLDELVGGKATFPPVVETLRLGGLEAWGPGWVEKTWTPEPETLNGDGSVFGGYTAALADQVLTFAAMTVVPANAQFRTINLAVSFFRIARDGPLKIRATVTSQTPSLISVRAEFRNEDGDLMAEATAQQIVRVIKAD